MKCPIVYVYELAEGGRLGFGFGLAVTSWKRFWASEKRRDASKHERVACPPYRCICHPPPPHPAPCTFALLHREVAWREDLVRIRVRVRGGGRVKIRVRVRVRVRVSGQGQG